MLPHIVYREVNSNGVYTGKYDPMECIQASMIPWNVYKAEGSHGLCSGQSATMVIANMLMNVYNRYGYHCSYYFTFCL